ncbi:MAG: hypothetical protein JST43_04190 [Bacteroidetes bacterium]|nr:hypothetical protein [Bacteroidota bacterium]MBS1539978.1 hypothetical protein [Bacteroidota bacterium]
MSTNSSPIDWNKTDLVTCVDLNHTTPTDKKEFDEVYHFLYASQAYQTLFAVYGKFDFSAEDMKVKGVDLQLLNYQGLINVGFCDVSASDIPKDSKTGDFFFGIQGGSQIRNMYLPVIDYQDNNQPTALQLKKGKATRIMFTRVLYQMDGFDKLDSNKLQKSVLFDTEFYSRTGTEWFANARHPGMTGAPKSVVTKRCWQSAVNLIHY